MPKIEIDEDEFNRLSALRGVAAKIVDNPQAKKLLEQAHKMVDPAAKTPALDAEKTVTEPLEALRKDIFDRLDKISSTQEEKERQGRIQAIADKQAVDKARLRKDGYTDEGLKAVEKIMEEKGLLDVADAVAIFERNNPPPIPATPGVGGWNFTDSTGDADKNIQDLIASRGANDQIADRMAREALAEFRNAALGR